MEHFTGAVTAKEIVHYIRRRKPSATTGTNSDKDLLLRDTKSPRKLAGKIVLENSLVCIFFRTRVDNSDRFA